MEIFQKKEINVMKTMKKVALMLCAVLAIGMMAGCGSFDASASGSAQSEPSLCRQREYRYSPTDSPPSSPFFVFNLNC